MKHLKLFEDTLLDYEAWGKKIHVRIDNDKNGGYVETEIGDDKNKVYLKTKNDQVKEGLFRDFFGSEYKDIVEKIYNYIDKMNPDEIIRKVRDNKLEFEYVKPSKPREDDPYGEENWNDDPQQKLRIKIDLETKTYYPSLYINDDEVDITRKEARKLSDLVVSKMDKRKDELKKERIRRAADIL